MDVKSPESKLPAFVTNRISIDLWSSLSYAIKEGVVAEQKWLYSETDGYDIGTIPTIYRMLHHQESDRLKRVGQGVTYKSPSKFVHLLALGYLLGTDFIDEFPPVPDEHGSNQLEGELKRYWAMKNGILQPAEVELTREIVDDYGEHYSFHHGGMLAERLGCKSEKDL